MKYRHPTRPNPSRDKWIAPLIALLVVLLVLVYPVAYLASGEDLTINVTGAERVCSGDNCTYRVYTGDETFENKDNFFLRKFNSADYQGRLQGGGEFDVTAHGWRIPFLSRFRNITNINSEPGA